MLKHLNSKKCDAHFNLSNIKEAYKYATRLLVFYPSIRIGEGTGHLRRVVGIMHQILKDIRCAVYIKNKEQIKEVAHNILKEFLELKEREVEEIMMSVFTQEQATNMVLKEKYNEGRLEGRLEGKLEGRSEGRLEGIQENTLYIAKMMKEQGLSLDIIINITGLSEDEINKL